MKSQSTRMIFNLLVTPTIFLVAVGSVRPAPLQAAEQNGGKNPPVQTRTLWSNPKLTNQAQPLPQVYVAARHLVRPRQTTPAGPTPAGATASASSAVLKTQTPRERLLEILAKSKPAPEPTDADALYVLAQEEILQDQYTPTLDEMSNRIQPQIQHAYALAQRGALYAARNEFLAALQRIAQAKDVAEKTTRHTVALSAGLRALTEAADFYPADAKDSLTTDLTLFASSHQTPILRQGIHGSRFLPYRAAAMYHQYAQRKLGAAVAGEKSGSMILHGIGKINQRLAQRNPNRPIYNRRAISLFQAALQAHNANHLAANELGVMLARDGHHAEAKKALELAVRNQANATTYQNLAKVQKTLGLKIESLATAATAAQLAQTEQSQGEVSRRKGILWVSPEDFSNPHLRNQKNSTPPQNLRPTFQQSVPIPPAPSHLAHLPDAKLPHHIQSDRATTTPVLKSVLLRQPTGRPRKPGNYNFQPANPSPTFSQQQRPSQHQLVFQRPVQHSTQQPVGLSQTSNQRPLKQPRKTYTIPGLRISGRPVTIPKLW